MPEMEFADTPNKMGMEVFFYTRISSDEEGDNVVGWCFFEYLPYRSSGPNRGMFVV